MTTVKTSMSDRVFTCHPDTPLPDVAHIMWDKDCGFVPVTAPKSGELVGVITDRDICMAAYTQGRPIGEIPTREVMNTEPHACRESDGLAKVHEIMRRYQVRRLPVTDAAGQPVGVISLNDLAIHAHEKNDKRALQEVACTLGGVSQHRLPMELTATAS